MNLAGFQKSSLIDYPGKLSAVIFTQGCNFRCFYCHNKSTWNMKKKGETKLSDVFDYLCKRRKMLDAVVITGGEPTLQKNLLGFMQAIKDLGYLIKLDTNGTEPDVILKAVQAGLIDYLAMDIKGPEKKYSEITGVKVNFKMIEESIKIIKNSGVSYEFRTTFCPPVLLKEDLNGIAILIGKCKKYALQSCNFEGIDQEKLLESLKNYQKSLGHQVARCLIR